MESILNFIDMNIINLGIGLISLMVGNILLGVGMSIVDDAQTFDGIKLIKGILKSTLVVLSFGLVYLAGSLNANIITIDINGQTVSLIDGINIVLTLGAGAYAKKVFDKLIETITLKTNK